MESKSLMHRALYAAMQGEISLRVIFGEIPYNALGHTITSSGFANDFPYAAGLIGGEYTAVVQRLSEEDVIFYVTNTDNDTTSYGILPIARIYQLIPTEPGTISLPDIAYCEPGGFVQRLIAYSIQTGTTVDGLIATASLVDKDSYYSTSTEPNWSVTNHRMANFSTIYTSDIANWSPPL